MGEKVIDWFQFIVTALTLLFAVGYTAAHSGAFAFLISVCAFYTMERAVPKASASREGV